MAASPSGKKSDSKGKARPQTKSQTGIKKKSAAAGTKSGGGTAPKRSGRSKDQSSSRSAPKRPRTGTKSASSSKRSGKSRTSKKAQGNGSALYSWLRGLTLGLVLGCAAILLAIYWPHIQQILNRAPRGSDPAHTARSTLTRPIEPPRPAPQSSPLQPGHQSRSSAKPITKTQQGLIYEEENSVDPLVKKLDQMLYVALQEIGVSDKKMDFLKVTRRHQGDAAWDHVLIQAGLPADRNVETAAAELERALTGSGRRSGVRPRLTRQADPKGILIDVYLDRMHTHTIRLLSPVYAAEPAARQTARPHQVMGPGKPRVAIVIDDFGMNRRMADDFMDLKVPITVSILPFLPHSKDIAQRAHQKGREVMLHLPMEPQKYPNIDPGPGVLLTSMDRNEIKKRVQAAIEAVPYIVAVNNHMGSRFTEDRERIGWALEEIHQHGLAFLDSMTSHRSQAFKEARRLNLITSYRSIFLDNIQDEKAIVVQLRKLVAQARQKGSAVGIGHVYPVTCHVLKNEYNQLNSKVDLVPFTRIFQN